MTEAPLPALFIGHGSPMNALEDNAFTRGWREAIADVRKPRAILCVSAHWETHGVFAGSSAAPPTIHDFYGFPKALFDVRYPAPGDPPLAQQIAQRIKSAKVQLDPERGLDHGIWSVLRVIYPAADIPLVPLSLDMTQPGTFHYRLAQELGALRDEGVLILGSGNTVHNLREFSFQQAQPHAWAARADAVIRARIQARDHAALADWSGLGADVARGIAGPEHFLPLLYVLATQRDSDPVRVFNDQVISSIAMTSVRIG